MESLVLADLRGDAVGPNHNLVGSDTLIVHGAQEALGDDGDDRRRKLDANLVTGPGGESIQDTVDGAGSPGGMERAKHEVAGFRGRDGGLDGLEVAHFTDEDDIGVLPERGADAFGEGGDVVVDFPLCHHATLVGVVILDGVLDCDDVTILVLVDPVDHRSEGRGLTGTGRTRHENEPARTAQEVLNHRRQAELLEREDRRGNEAQDHAEHAFTAVDVDAETSLLVERETEVTAAVALEALDLLGGRNGAHQRLGILVRERGAFNRDHTATDAETRRPADVQVQVGSAILDHGFQELVNLVRHDKLR